MYTFWILSMIHTNIHIRQTYAYVAWAGRNKDDHSGARRQAPWRALVVGTDGLEQGTVGITTWTRLLIVQ
jgi:hypothetical protein